VCPPPEARARNFSKKPAKALFEKFSNRTGRLAVTPYSGRFYV
jgi:hypothetical protein